MSSSSSSSPPPPQELNLFSNISDLAGHDHAHGLQPNNYDLFISFRGTDVRDTFLSHLYTHLNDLRKLAVYKDDVDLPRGMEISPLILQAIEKSDVYIVVLSPSYTDSSWCLDELEHILDCKQRYGRRVIPVFYGVDPSVIENQKLPSTTTAGIGKVQRWRSALRKIANLSGFSSIVIRPETKLMEEIAEAVFQAIPGGGQDVSSYLSTRGLVGLEQKMVELERLMCLEARSGNNNRMIIGLWGMAGIGKTLQAKVVFDLFSCRFEASYFFSNFAERVASAAEMLHGHDLQNFLFSKLLGDDIAGGRLSYLTLRRLGRMKAFVVIDGVGDDVGDIGPLRDLFNGQYCYLFGPGSRIIVTSRNQQLLKSVCHHVYEVKALNHGEAFRLFCLHAFKGDSPQSEYMDMALRATRYASGNPLAITVLGAHLHRRGLEFWDLELKALQDNPIPKVENVLRRSYDGLSRAEKDVFLDFACFCKSWIGDWLPIEEMILHGRVNILTKLCDKSLLSTDIGTGSIGMNRLLIDLGRNIVNEERQIEKRSRLWKTEDVYYLFRENKGTQSIEGIILWDPYDRAHDSYLQTYAFAKMENLQLLVIDGDGSSNIMLPQDGLKCLPNTLRILAWYSFASKCLPSQFSAENLVALYLWNSKIEQLWKEDELNLDLGNLKFLVLDGSESLRKLPDLSTAKRLEEIYLCLCESLVELPNSILDLPKLESLHVGNCTNLKWDNLEAYANSSREQSSRPSDFLPNLTKLDLSGTPILKVPNFITQLHILDLRCYQCTKLTELPVIPTLERLTLTGSSIEELVELEKLTELKSLNLSRNEHLVLISGDFSKLKYLTKIQLDGCSKLSRLPGSIGNLIHLESLDLSCTALRELPSSIGDLLRLSELRLVCCKSLASLPDTISKLPRLGRLDLAGCDQLRHLPELPSPLRNLDAHGCKSLQTLSIGNVEKHDFTFIYWSFAQCWMLDPGICSKLVDKDSLRVRVCSSLLVPATNNEEGSTTGSNNSNNNTMVTIVSGGQPWKSKSTLFCALLNSLDPLICQGYDFVVECVMLNNNNNPRRSVSSCDWKPYREHENPMEGHLSNGDFLIWSTSGPLVASNNADDGSTLKLLFRVRDDNGYEVPNLIKNCRVIPVYDDRVVMNEDEDDEEEDDDQYPNELRGLYDQMCTHTPLKIFNKEKACFFSSVSTVGNHMC